MSPIIPYSHYYWVRGPPNIEFYLGIHGIHMRVHIGREGGL